MQDTNIEWADLTWNPTRGCSRVSPGCQRCYAEVIAARFGGLADEPGTCKDQPFAGYAEFRIVGGKREAHWTGKVDLIEDKLLEPLSRRKWALKFAQEHGRKPRCFVNSMSDLFHEILPSASIERVLGVIAWCREIDFLVLTKRADRVEEFFRWFAGRNHCIEVDGIGTGSVRSASWIDPLDNLWIGVSVEDQKRADERIPHLLRTPAAVRFISAEPLLERVDLFYEVDGLLRGPGVVVSGGMTKGTADYPPEGYDDSYSGLDWVIVGGESGPGARPFDIAWARSIRDQCKAAGVAFYMKQMGSDPYFEKEVGTAKGGCPVMMNLKDKKGGSMAEWTGDLRIREFPQKSIAQDE